MVLHINENEIKSVISLNVQKRYIYFIKKVADTGVVWGLYNEGWALAEDKEGNTYLPFWPAEEYAALCAVNEWSNYKPEAMDVHDFIDQYIEELEANNIIPSIFITPNDNGILTEGSKIRHDLGIELAKIE